MTREGGWKRRGQSWGLNNHFHDKGPLGFPRGPQRPVTSVDSIHLLISLTPSPPAPSADTSAPRTMWAARDRENPRENSLALEVAGCRPGHLGNAKSLQSLTGEGSRGLAMPTVLFYLPRPGYTGLVWALRQGPELIEATPLTLRVTQFKGEDTCPQPLGRSWAWPGHQVA